ncbi:uncharacterized protein LOC115975321 [Quercus lobata]|uniref:uncharacterized protein LOC115975321 n=1 Tax=Quercus lobata TaxID=97700 RepID=UPI001247D61A|nr:uncharacterized protein LOC115975321 [Quercus lobata]
MEKETEKEAEFSFRTTVRSLSKFRPPDCWNRHRQRYDHIFLDGGSSLFTIGFVPPQCMSIPCNAEVTIDCHSHRQQSSTSTLTFQKSQRKLCQKDLLKDWMDNFLT